MKQRSALTATLLSVFIPFYTIYWLYVTAKDMTQRGVEAVPSFRLILAPLGFLLIMMAVPFFLATSPRGNTSPTSNIAIILIEMVAVALCVIFPVIYYYRFCEAVGKATGEDLKVLLFVLMLFVAPAAVYVAQDKLNSTTIVATTAGGAPQPVSPESTTATPPEQSPPSNPVSA